ncbi:ADP-forming succinate--CoA ligase subunit beta [candidate division KSB1 bacterium]|nr:ADP-forming succinate--CoA ligase subunit beta [candidate division KSB1 bacterium]
MKIHEYQAKQILRQYQVAIPRGQVASTPAEAQKIAAELGGTVVVKAQIHAGGRGKGGGIKLAHAPEEAARLTAQMIGSRLVTPQTGPEGKIVHQVLIEAGLEIERELYAGIVLDRSRSQLVFMVSTAGGMEIEKVAAEMPEKILKAYIDNHLGLQAFQARQLTFGLGLSGPQHKHGVQFLMALATAFVKIDASLAEINPLVVTKTGEVLALDAKINLDDNALFRHPDLAAMRDITEEEPLEVEASKFNLNYIKLDGNVACMVNGAGLAMATMDLIKLAGSMPANFLDVGGTASVETVANGFRILLSDANVKAVLINIFGGIVRCDRVAQGVIDAVRTVGVKVPVVIRLAGTNAAEAANLLSTSGLEFLVATSFEEAAQKVVQATA